MDPAAALINAEVRTYALRWMAFALIAGGLAHFIGAGVLYQEQGLPSVDRLGYIIMIGVIQIGVGALNLVTRWLIRSQNRLALGSHAIAVILITGYFLAILPSYPNFSALFRLAPPVYLLYHWWVMIRLRADSKL